ncbi:MAG: hypothetical protein SFW35_00535 [Chitinophagales bacterium]|nr:hypothetical protein [Chitinophagales bacterium]
MKVESIEILLVCVIVGVQLYLFMQTYKNIVLLRTVIPQIPSLKISKVLVPIKDLEQLTPTDILRNIHRYKEALKVVPINKAFAGDFGDGDTTDLFTYVEQENHVEKAEVNVIESNVKTNHVFDSILFSVNNYLIRNRGAASDFNLIKDIVERNTNAVEEDINLSIGIPLYLGLMGTMIGIVIGLFSMPDLAVVVDSKAKDILLNDGISSLIGGVKVAMIASFVGLLLTIFNSGWNFKGSKSLVEKRKNEFYTFIQIELLPIINQGLASTLESLQRNLLKFNSEFTTNLRQLDGIFDSNTKAIIAQKELLDSIDKTKVSEMTRYNVKVLQQLDMSVGQFEKFNHYLTNITLFLDNSKQIVSQTNELLKRTDNFQVIAENLDSRLRQSQMLLDFLYGHFNKLEEHKVYTANAVADVGHSISSTFAELKAHIQNSSDAVKEFTIKELDLLKTALSESKTNLSNLQHLSTISTDVSQFKMSSASQLERLKAHIDSTNYELSSINSNLKKIDTTINGRSTTAKLKKIYDWINAKR